MGFGGTDADQGITNFRTWLRGTADFRHRRPVGPFEVRGRAWLAGVVKFGGANPGQPASTLPPQRRIYLAGADPYQTFNNPFLRSDGALLVKPDVNYQAAGGAGLRGYDATLAATWAAALNMELMKALFRAPRRHAFTGLSLALFADAAATHSPDLTGLADAGVGVRATHRVGPTNFATRLDFPLLVSDPSRAVGASAGDGHTKFRFVWSFEEAF
jgi:hypothetical protein